MIDEAYSSIQVGSNLAPFSVYSVLPMLHSSNPLHQPSLYFIRFYGRVRKTLLLDLNLLWTIERQTNLSTEPRPLPTPATAIKSSQTRL